jgi:hypothetical protein
MTQLLAPPPGEKVKAELQRRARQILPPTPKAVLIANLSDPEILERVERRCRQVVKDYPSGAEPYFLWRAFWAAGIEVPYVDSIEKFDHLAKKMGWEVLAVTESPEPGDVAIYKKSERSLGAEFVVKPMDSGDYLGVGVAGKGVRRAVDGNPTTSSGPVVYFLRRPCPTCSANR